MNRIKICIVEDQELFLDSLKIILDNTDDMEVVGIAVCAEDIFDILKKNDVDIVLMDIRLPKMNGVECTKIVKENYPNTKVILLTTFEDDEYIFFGLQYGASGYLLKGIKVPELLNAIRIVYDGGAMLNPNISAKIVKYFSSILLSKPNFAQIAEYKKMNSNEQQIIELISNGYTNAEISKIIHLSEGTVRNYVSDILSKLRLRDRTQLAIFMVQNSTFIRYNN